jgi:environmental stress-induced protein Ves
MRILRREHYRQMPWKNGAGLTEEVMTYPKGSDISDFGWRLSIAHVGADGPFSVFAGIDRTIALLGGDGLILDLPDRSVELAADGPPFAFSGDLVVSSRNVGGPTIDLNIMTRRGVFQHRMVRVASGEALPSFQADATTLVVFTTAGTLDDGGKRLDVAAFDTAHFEPGDALAGLVVAAPALVVTVFPA